MKIRCPHCANAVEVIEQTSFEDIPCEACGSHFSLVDQQAGVETLPPEDQTIDHFRLIHAVGTGAYGTVYKAKDTELDRTVAVKIPRRQNMGEEEQQQFLREARAAAQLTHRNIVGVHEVGRDDETLYIVSDFVEGIDLAEELTVDRYTPRQAAQLCVKIANALEHAHQSGVIHRDLKPSNIMLDNDNEPQVMDFGLAKREAGEITMTWEGKLLGTPAYMPPEQARGEGHDVDGRADIYSLGVILYELLTGELPFRGSARMLLNQVIHDEAPSPRKLQSSIPKDLETITLKCLEKLPEKRYQTCQEFANDLQAWLDHKPIKARPVGQLGKLLRWRKRNPVVANLSGGIAIVLLLSAALSINFALTAQNEAELARQARDKATASEAAAIQSQTEAIEQKEKAEASEQKANLATLEAVTQKEKAETAEKRLQLQFDYLLSIFKAVDPSKQGKDLKVVDLILPLSQTIDKEFNDRPVFKIQLRILLGNTFNNIGEPQSAITQFELGIEEGMSGNIPPRLRVDLHRGAGDAYLQLGNKDGYIRQMELAIDVCMQEMPEDVVTLAILRANITNHQGGLTNAINKYLPIAALLSGIRREELLKKFYEATDQIRSLGKMGKDEELDRYISEITRPFSAIPNYEENLGMAVAGTAFFASEDADFALALPLARWAVKFLEAETGSKSSKYLNARIVYGICLMAAGKYDYATNEFRGVMEVALQEYGRSHTITLEGIQYQITCLLALEMPEAALKLASETVALLVESEIDNDNLVYKLRLNHAISLRHCEQADKAVLELKKLIDEYAGTGLGYWSKFELANSYFSLGEYEKAAELLGPLIKAASPTPVMSKVRFQKVIALQAKLDFVDEEIKQARILQKGVQDVYRRYLGVDHPLWKKSRDALDDLLIRDKD